MSRLTKIPNEANNEAVKGFSMMNAVIMIVLMLLFMAATTYVLIKSLQ
jgi:hypothetical protein